MFTVYPIDTLHVNDNYAWAIIPENARDAYIVDPGEAEAVLQWLTEHGYQLAGILVTHRHWDHVNGINGLLAARAVPVWGPHSVALPEHAQRLAEGDSLQVGAVPLQVMAIPGHTREHIAYYSDAGAAPALFCGDTLFACGCGRVFDGAVDQLYASLCRLKRLPPETQIFCAHEYTLANLAFAQAVEPDNPAIISRREHVEQQRERGEPSLPSRLDLELQTNPFLRVECPEVVDAAISYSDGAAVHTDSDDMGLRVFATLRRWKDSF